MREDARRVIRVARPTRKDQPGTHSVLGGIAAGTRETTSPPAFRWIDTTQADPAAAASFYAGLFGWEIQETIAVHPRRYALKNRERTNRLLMLRQLPANGDDSETAYRKAILDWPLANDGRPNAVRRFITDPLEMPSLR